MSTLMRKRMMTRSNTPSKRRKLDSTMVLYRNVGIKPEMKYIDTAIVHSASVATTRLINSIAQGTGTSNRVGTKVKLHYIELLLVADAGTRATLINPNSATVSPALNYTGAVDRRLDSVILDKFIHSGNTELDYRGAFITHKLPLGMVCRYGDAAGSTINDNAVYLTLTQLTAATVQGYARVWFTDV